MNELERLKHLQQSIVNPSVEISQPGAMEQILLRMLGDMQLAGLTERTQEGYVRAVRKVGEHYRKPPDQISDEELREYFLYVMNVRPAGQLEPRRSNDLCGFPVRTACRP